MDLSVRPLTPELWPALEELFGPGGASNGCWCMYWRIGAEYHKRPRARNREALRESVEAGPPPGLLAFAAEKPVGWCRLGPRAELEWLRRDRRLALEDDLPVWSLSCFYVRGGHRRQGVATALIEAAIAATRAAAAPALEAYPVDAEVPGATRNVFTGTAAMFRRAGFATVGQRSPARPVMRHDLR